PPRGPRRTGAARRAGRRSRETPLFLRAEPPAGGRGAGSQPAGRGSALGRGQSLAVPASAKRLIIFLEFGNYVGATGRCFTLGSRSRNQPLSVRCRHGRLESPCQRDFRQPIGVTAAATTSRPRTGLWCRRRVAAAGGGAAGSPCPGRQLPRSARRRRCFARGTGPVAGSPRFRPSPASRRQRRPPPPPRPAA